MARLKHTFKTDTLFKMLFTRHQDLLKRLVAELLGIRHGSIERFEVTNPEMPPELLGGKFCRLDINMVVDGQLVNLEIQVRDEDDYPERVLFHWARIYSSALPKGDDYKNLPRSVVISIIDFNLFDCAEFHSEFRPLETTRGELLSDRMSLHFFELKKVPAQTNAGDMLLLWLLLFKARTEADIRKIRALEVPELEQALNAFDQIRGSREFLELERQREIMRMNEASALRHARDKATAKERMKWQGVVSGKDAVIANKDAENERLRAELDELRAKLEN